MVLVLYLVSLRPAPIAAPSVKVRPAKKGSRPVMAATCHNPRIKEALAARIKWTKASETWLENIKFQVRQDFKLETPIVTKFNEEQSQPIGEGVAGGKSLMRTPQWGLGKQATFPLMSSRSLNLCTHCDGAFV